MRKKEIVLLLTLFLAILFISLISSASLKQNYILTKGDSIDNKFIISGEGSEGILKYSNISKGSEYFNIEKEDKQKRINSFDLNQVQELTTSIESSLDYNLKDENSYIIEFKKPSVLEKQKDLNEEIEKIKKEAQVSGEIKGMFSIQSLESKLKQKEQENQRVLSNHKNELKLEHSYALNDINSILKQGELASLNPLERFINFIKRLFGITGFAVFDSDELKPKREYFNTFNGVALDISKEDAEKLKDSEYVKNVYPNEKVYANLMDSIPLINADDVWQLDEDGNNCTETGKPCLNGENITIAIIDTGIDYTHPDFGGEIYNNLERNLTKINNIPLDIFDPDYDQMFKLNGNKIAYYSGNTLFVYDFNTNETIKIFAPVEEIIRLGFENNLIAYFGLKDSVGVYFYDLNTGNHTQLVQATGEVGYIFVSNGKIIYETVLNSKSEIFIYDPLTKQTNSISEDLGYISHPAVRGNLIAYSVYGISDKCYDKAIIYNIDTQEKIEVVPPNLGPIFDIKDNKILYVECDKDGPAYPNWDTDYLYDYITSESIILKYPKEKEGAGSPTPMAMGGFGTSSWINKGAIGDGVVYFSKDVNAKDIIAYDLNLQRYVLINLFKKSGAISGEGNKICFISSDLYCHDYNPEYDYPIPKTIFGEKVVGGYDFVNNDNDPMDDHGHGTHVAGIAAGKSQGNLIENYKYQEGNYVGIGEYLIYNGEDDNNNPQIFYLESIKVDPENSSRLFISLSEDNENSGDNIALTIIGDYAYSDSGDVYIKADIINRKISLTWGSGAGYDNPGNFVSNFDINISKPIGLNGVAPKAKLYAYKVLDSQGSGSWSDVMAGIERAVDPNKDGDFLDHADIISLSLGSDCGEYSSECGPDDAVSQAIDNAVSNGVIAVIAAGNSGPGFETIGSPGTARKAITVGASNKWDGLADFSSKGPVIWKDIQGNEKYLIKPDIVAPGYEICSAQYDSAWNDRKCFDNNHVAISGTSMATPHVAGAAALLKQAHPDFTPEQIKSQLQNTAKDILESEDSSKKLFSYGYGRLDILNAVVNKTPVLGLEINMNKDLGIINMTYKADGDNLKNYSLLYKQIDSNTWEQLTSSTQLNNLQNIFQISELDNGELFFKLEIYDNNNNLFHKEIMTKIENIKPYISNKYNYLTEQFEKIYVNVYSGNYISYEIYFSNSSQETLIYSSSNSLQSGEIAEINTDGINNGKYNLIIRAEHESGKIIDSEPIEVIVFKSLRNGLTGFSELEAPRYFSVSDLEGDKKITFMSEEHEQLGGGWYRIYNNIEIWKADNREKLINKNNKLWGGDIPYELFNPQGYGLYNTGQTQLIFDDVWKQGEGDEVIYGNREGIIGKDLSYLYSWPSNIQDTRLHYGDYYSRVFDSKIYSLYEYDNWSLIDINYSAFWNSQVYKIKIHNKYGELINNLEFKQFKHIEDAPSSWGGMLPSPKLFFIGEDTSKLGVISAGKLDYYANGQEKNTNWMDLIIFDLETEQQIISKDIPVDLDDFYSLNSVISGDVDNDNLTEIIISYNSLNRTLYDENIYNPQVYHQNFLILDANGNEKYPKISFVGYVGYNDAIITEYNNKKYIVSSLSGTWATGSTDQLVIFDLQGNILTNITNGYDQIIYEPISGDIDSDGVTEIIYSTYPRFWAEDNGINSHINIINITGNLEKDIEFYNGFIASQIALSDYNNNQQLDLSVIGESFDGFNSLGTTLYNFNLGSDYNESNLYWPIKWNNPQRTNCYESKGKELTSYLELNSLMQVNTLSQISLKIENNYNSVKQVNYSVYSSPCNFEDRETCSYELINSKNISVSGNSEYEEEIQFTPSNIGEYVLKLEVLEEGNLEPKADYYSTKALEFFADLSVDYLSVYGVFVGQETEIGVYISNYGNMGSNATVSLYYEKGGCGYSCNNLTLIETKQDIFERGESKRVMFNWVPLEAGDITLVAKVNVSNDINPDNDIRYNIIYVSPDSPDLNLGLGWYQLVVNRLGNISVWVNNRGGSSAENINLSVYYQKGDCGDYCNNLTFLGSRNTNINAFMSKEELFEFTPDEVGEYTFVTIANLTNDYNQEDNVQTARVYVSPEIPDLSLDIWVSNLIVDEPGNISIQVENNGASIAENVTLYFYYQKDYCYEDCNNLELIGTRNFSLQGFGFREERFVFIPDEAGLYTFVAMVNSSNEYNAEDNIRYDSFYVSPKAADLNWHFYDLDNIIVNQTKNITIVIYNDGAESTENASLLFYYQKGNCYDYCDNPILLIEKNISIGAFGKLNEFFEFNPNEVGEYTFVGILNASNEYTPENNIGYTIMYVSPESTDLRVNMWGSYFVVNEPSNINVEVENRGGSRAENISLLVYYQKGDCGEECDNLVLLGSKKINVNAFEWTKELFEFTPDETGMYTFVAIANLTNDYNQEDNTDIGIFTVNPVGCDLGSYISIPSLLVGEDSNIYIKIYNFGNQAAEDAAVYLYYQKGYCYDHCDNLTLIGSRDINIDVYNSVQEIFNFTPTELGGYTFVAIVNASNDYYEENNMQPQGFYVLERGPNLVGYVESYYDDVFYVNEENKVNITISNLGTDIANNVNISLYELSRAPCFHVGCDEEISYSFIGSYLIPQLDVDEQAKIQIPWTPNKTGDNYLYLNSSCDGEVYQEDNDYISLIYVIRNGIDIYLENLYLGRNKALLNKPIEAEVGLENRGLEAHNITLNIYDNGLLSFNNKINTIFSRDYFYEPFTIVPDTLGLHNISAEAIAEDEIYLDDNYLEKQIYVYNPINLTINIKDSDGNDVDRYFVSDDLLDYESFINKTTVIETYNLSETNSNLSFILAKAGGIYGKSLLSYIEVNAFFNNNINIVSDFYNKTTQDYKNYYAVFANNISLINEKTLAHLSFFQSYFPELQDENIDDYTLFFCTNFSFSNKKCNELWKPLPINYYYKYDLDLDEEGSQILASFEALTPKNLQAFALSESANFDGNTTNLSIISGDTANNLIFEKTRHGRIRFLNPINISRFKQNPNLLTDNIIISYRGMVIDTDILPELKNKTAELLFKNIDLHNPKVFYNGVECPSSICSGITYNTNNHTVLLNVTGFSEFNITEGPYCGDHNKDTGETCSNCVADMGVCPEPIVLPDEDEDEDEGTPRNCTPSWNCVWGPCKDNKKALVCIDAAHCGVLAGKPTDTKICLVESNCTDNDGDGYGVGPDCVGLDLNDNDIGVTNTFPINPEKNKGFNFEFLKKYAKPAGIIISILISIVVLIIIILLLVRHIMKRTHYKENTTSYTENNKINVLRARNFVKEARLRGLSDREIKRLLLEKQWKEEDINEAM